MARKVFVSYKYKDEKVADLKEFYYRKTRVRDYVDRLQEKIGSDNINLGEKDGESLEDFSDEKIGSISIVSLLERFPQQ